MRKKYTLAIILLILLAAGVGYYWRFLKKPPSSVQVSRSIPTQSISSRGACLADDEFANFTIAPGENAVEQYGARPGIVTILIGSTINPTRTKKLFDVDTFLYNSAYPAEIHKCHVYIIRLVGPYSYYSKNESNWYLLPGGMISIWRYDYSGKGEKVIDLLQRDEKGNMVFHFIPGDYSADGSETYIALMGPKPDDGNRHLVVLNMKTGQTVYSVGVLDLAKEYNVDPGIGDFEALSWSDSTLHFQLTNSNVAFELEKDTWKIIYVW